MDNGSDKNFTSFLDWSVSEVIEWLQSLSLHGNYERQFQEGNVDGKLLLKFNQSLLDQLQVTDSDDRVTILQMITAMRADLMTNSNDSNAIIKIPRPNSAGSLRSRHLSASNMQSSESSRNSTPIGDSTIPGHGRHRHHSVTAELKNWEHRRLLSKSLDRLTESDESSQKSSAHSSKQFSSTSSSRLVDILREENASLRKDLDSYYQRVRKLHKIEQEVERIREAHKLLEESTKRREKLENTMRTKMEHQLKKLKEANIQLEMELQTVRINGSSQPAAPNESTDDKAKREIARRDSMIKRLIKQNKDSASEREKLQKDLQNTKTALEDIKKEETSSVTTQNSNSNASSPRILGDEQSHLAEMYSKSLDNLRAILNEMTAMSENKEKIENRLRVQLMQELAALKQKQHSNGVPQVDNNVMASYNGKVASLEVKVARLEHKCLELVAEKQMELDAATVPRDTMIAQMKRTIAEQKDTIEELRQQKMKYMVQLYDANKKLADLENKKALLQLNIAEKESLIQTLQQSYAEVDDDLWAANGEEVSPTLKALSPSPMVVSPGSPKRSSFHELHSSNGTLVGDVNEGGSRLMSSHSISYSPTGKAKFSGLNLAIATSINDFSPIGQPRHYSSSVPSSPRVTHRLLHTSVQPSRKDNFMKSQSAESAWMFSCPPRELGDQKLSKSSSGGITHANKNYTHSHRIPKSFSTGRNSPLADYSQDSGFGVFNSASGVSCDTGFSSREESRHTPWQV